LVGVLAASSADAQEQSAVLQPTDATRPLEAQLRGDSGPSPIALRLMQADVRRYEVERAQGWTLFAWGAVNVAQGLGVAIPALTASTVDERAASYGVWTASWGAVNLALAIPWVARLPRERARTERWSRLSSSELARELERARDDARSAGSFFALNTGLDVAYITAGSLLWYMGERPESRSASLSGAGIAVLVQGAALLAFDAWGWAARNADSARWSEISAGALRF
jgi:hypothetical protein